MRGSVRYTYERLALVGNRPDDLIATYGLSLSNF